MSSFANLPRKSIDTTDEVVSLFNVVFFEEFNTRLQGGAEEPLYIPALSSINGYIDTDDTVVNPASAIIYFRHNYLSSALHEISHWTIVGKKRRQLEDYGYWYETDERTKEAQKKFEEVEIKPQAIELLLHIAIDLPFRVSVDNLSLLDYDSEPFLKEVIQQARIYCEVGIPVRAKRFIKALITGRDYQLSHFNFPLEDWLLTELASL